MSPTAAALATSRSLLGLQNMARAEIAGLLSRARAGEPERSLAGRLMANLFFEDSTRTMTSFSVAAKRLGMQTINLRGAASSVSKGETLVDTALNVEAMGVDALVVRARQSGAAVGIARAVKCAVINAGDGRHEHPTQGLLDAYTLAESHGRLEDFDLAGLTVAIVGDIASSRVARSNIAGLGALGANVVCVGPPGLAPASLKSLGCEVSADLDGLLPVIDAVMVLRMQFERHDEEGGEKKPEGDRRSAMIASVRDYRELYAMTPARAERMKKGAVVMHPGPMNRGLEIDAEVADGPRSVILRQVTNGARVRMAVLGWCLGRDG
ncbi:MAG: aspartate carbamoyltransferase catalytic subunit [Phycisphaerales bacterium]|nr:aspartate carbamoyltransferase catalytic subunit [Phycisphaerales bacterium]